MPDAIPLANIPDQVVILIGAQGDPERASANNLALIAALLDRLITSIDCLAERAR